MRCSQPNHTCCHVTAKGLLPMNTDAESNTFHDWSGPSDVILRHVHEALPATSSSALDDQAVARLQLSWTEREFLQRLLTNKRVSYEEAAITLLHRTDMGATRAVYRLVNKLKRKLGPLASHIQAARSAGYVLVQ
jgi:DNA-binding response OmpR family regulator